jgi:hypothetical protein
MVPVDAQPVLMPETGESGSAAIMGSNVAPAVVDHSDPQKRAVVAVTVLSIVASLVLLSLAASMAIMYKRRQLQKNRHVVERWLHVHRAGRCHTAHYVMGLNPRWCLTHVVITEKI